MNYPRVISYIDGYNLYYGLRDSGQRWAYWLNLQQLSQQFLMPGQNLVHTKYFTTIVTTPADKRTRQTTFIEALQTLPDFTIYYGQFLAETVTCSKCGHTYTTHHEKMTDVNIAIHLITDAIQDKFDVALLISADSDLAIAIKNMKEMAPTKKVICIFPPKRTSNHLKNLADGARHIDQKILSRSLFPDPIFKPNGYQLHRPSSWK